MREVKNEAIDWFLKSFSIPEGVLIKAESSYQDDFDSGIYLRRNFLLDFSNCSDFFLKISDKGSSKLLLLRWYFFDVIESYLSEHFNETLSECLLSGEEGENVVCLYGQWGAVRWTPKIGPGAKL